MKILLSLLTVSVSFVLMSFATSNTSSETTPPNDTVCCTVQDGPVIVYTCTNDGTDPCEVAAETIKKSTFPE